MNKILSKPPASSATLHIKKLLKNIALIATAGFIGHSYGDVQPLSVSGNKILAGNQVASFAGNSLFWSNNGWGGEKFYNAGTVGWLKSDWKSQLIRAAMGVDEGGGYLQDPVGNKAKVKAVVDAAIANDMYVIIDWHSHHAEQYQSQSIAFFQEMARTYGNTNNVIYEIYNEPLDNASWSGTIKPYAQAVVSAIRGIDPDNLIIVGTRTWSQRVDEAASDPVAGKNIAYTLHFYASSHGQYLRDIAQTALNKNAALFVTEWGSVNASGDGAVNYSETNAWVEFMKKNNISHANWALNDKAEGSSALVSGASGNGGWTSNQLTASGAFTKDIISNWPGATPTECNEVAVPATIEAEKFCQMSGVETESTSDTNGGSNLGYIDQGDWMTYSVNVPASGSYTVSYRVASLNGGGVIQLEQAGGSPVFGSVNVAATSGWQNWTTVSHTVQLSAGRQRIAVAAKSGGFNLNWIKIQSNGSSSSSSSSSSSGSTPLATLQAESYRIMNGVQTEAASDVGGGLNVGYIDAGDWMSYDNTSVTVPETGTYTVQFRVASALSGGNLSFEEAGANSYASVAIPNTGGWQNWTTVKTSITLTAGTHKFGIKANTGGWNINWFSITKGIN